MGRQTADLIRHLAADSAAVRPLPRPWTRTAVWLGVSLLYVAALYGIWLPDASIRSDAGFVTEQLAAMTTGVLAALAAFASVVPGYSRRLAYASLVPLAVWLSSLGQSCARDWAASASLSPIGTHWACFPVTVVVGLVPASLLIVMLRRGAPVAPRLTSALSGLAAASLANVAIRFVHTADASVIVLLWHVLAVFALSSVLTVVANHVFTWRRTSSA
jgi:hypothetical protein